MSYIIIIIIIIIIIQKNIVTKKKTSGSSGRSSIRSRTNADYSRSIEWCTAAGESGTSEWKLLRLAKIGKCKPANPYFLQLFSPNAAKQIAPGDILPTQWQTK